MAFICGKQNIHESGHLGRAHERSGERAGGTNNHRLHDTIPPYYILAALENLWLIPQGKKRSS